MKQTGRFYTLQNDKDGVQTEKPVKNTFLYFYQNDIRKITAQTDANGNFNFDLPIGSYTIKISQGASFAILDLFAGVPFELTSGSSQTALNDWLMNPVTAKPEQNPLVVRLQELAQIATDAATEAQQIQQDLANKGYYNPENTRKDKNNVLHATTGTPKDTMLVGDFGAGSANPPAIDVNNLNEVVTCFSSNFGTIDGMPTGSKAGIVFKRGADITHLLYSTINGDVYLTTKWGDRVSTTNSLWGTRNTTVDSNGFIKKASPIIKLFDDRIEHNDQFKEEPEFEKIDIGTYKISNTLGLAKGIEQGDWYIETPKNRNGLPYFMVEWEQCPETDEVIIRCFERKFDIEIGDFVNGELKDIGKDERWIDLRFHEEIEEHEIIE